MTEVQFIFLVGLSFKAAGPKPKVLLQEQTRLRTYYGSQKMTVDAMQMAEKKVWAHRS